MTFDLHDALSARPDRVQKRMIAEPRNLCADHLCSANDQCALAVIEGPARSRTMGHVHDRGGLWWFIVLRLREAGIPVAVCPPDNRPYWATGYKSGPKADKANVAIAVARFWDLNDEARTNDEYDGLVLATLGAQMLGWAPVGPKREREALQRVEWPVGPLQEVDHG